MNERKVEVEAKSPVNVEQYVTADVFDAFVAATNARLAKIESRINPSDKPMELPEKRNNNPDYLPHGISGVVGLDQLPKKAS